MSFVEFSPLFVSLGLGYVLAGILLPRHPLLRLAVSALVLAVAASVSVWVSIIIGAAIQRELTMAIIAIASLVAVLSARKSIGLARVSLFAAQALGVVSLLYLAELAVRSLGVASIAFGDVLTILRFAAFLERAEGLGGFDGFMALKRGGGFPSVQSLAPAGDFSHGLMVVLFLGWVLASSHLILWLMRSHSGNARALALVAFFGLSVSTEAVLRNVLFMSSHVLVGLSILVLIIIYLEKLSGPLVPVVVGLASVSAVLMRADNALIIMFPLGLILFGQIISGKVIKSVLVLATMGALPLSILGFQINVSTGLIVAVATLAVVGAGLAYSLPVRAQQAIHDYTMRRAVFIPLAGILISVATSVSLVSFEALYQNYLMTEGLWGYTVLAVIVLAIAGRFVGSASPENRDTLRLGAGVLGMVIFAKFGDVILGGGSFEFARIGWGDSLNRLLIYVYAPLLAYGLATMIRTKAAQKG